MAVRKHAPRPLLHGALTELPRSRPRIDADNNFSTWWFSFLEISRHIDDSISRSSDERGLSLSPRRRMMTSRGENSIQRMSSTSTKPSSWEGEGKREGKKSKKGLSVIFLRVRGAACDSGPLFLVENQLSATAPLVGLRKGSSRQGNVKPLTL